MRKLKNIIDNAKKGNLVLGMKLSLFDIQELDRMYLKLVKNKRDTFVNNNCYTVLSACGLNVKPYSVGWVVSR